VNPHSGLRVARPVLVAVVGVLLLLVDPVAVQAEARASEPVEGESWRQIVRRMLAAASEQAFEGRVVVVSFDPTPTISEVTVVRGPDGTFMSGGPRTWVLGHQEGETVLGDFASGTLLRVGTERQPTFSIARMERNYEIAVRGGEDGGPVVLEFRPRATNHLRERVHVDRDSGLVLRRETYDDTEAPVRLVAFTTLETGPASSPEVSWDDMTEVRPTAASISERGREILRDVGWTVPTDLRGGFALMDAVALGEGDVSSLHLLYSDGLYALSVYQQPGRLDAARMMARGAEPARLGGLDVLRWPVSEPAAYVWEGQDMTFTLVSDAPHDALAKAAAAFPHERAPSLVERVRQRLESLLRRG
jgi:hypothetical protein